MKAVSPSPVCIQSNITGNSLKYMPSRANGTSTVLASVYCLMWPSQARLYSSSTTSGAPSACSVVQLAKFSAASSAPSSPDQRGTQRR